MPISILRFYRARLTQKLATPTRDVFCCRNGEKQIPSGNDNQKDKTKANAASATHHPFLTQIIDFIEFQLSHIELNDLVSII